MPLDFWTFDCWNCYNSFLWRNNLKKRLEKKALQVTGVHAPEFSHEKVRNNIEAKVKEFNLHHLTMIDTDLPAIIITGDTAADRLREAQTSDALLLHKPVSTTELHRTVANLLTNKSD
jgi:DNA-binding NtrC family response regulator